MSLCSAPAAAGPESFFRLGDCPLIRHHRDHRRHPHPSDTSWPGAAHQRLVGNFPQVFSHLGLGRAAQAIRKAERVD